MSSVARKKLLIGGFALMTAVALVMACDTTTQITEIVDDPCYQNEGPALGNVFLLLRRDDAGAAYAPFASPPRIKAGERVEVFVEYNDEECNFTRGDLFQRFDDVQNWSVVVPADDIGCSDVDDGYKPLVFEIDISNLAAGGHTLQIVGRDSCDEFGNVTSANFIVLPGGASGDDDDDAADDDAADDDAADDDDDAI
ncbi:hypothetical protein K8I61_09760 [bacterium]|nr:hypothetical protein [bacterium]